MNIYVDVDGTLLSPTLDNEYKEKVNIEGIDFARRWYAKQYVNDLKLNYELVEKLRILKSQGNKLVIWTNRGEEQRKMTLQNLGEISYLFHEVRFRDGQKGKDKLDGFVFDNEEKYLNCGIDGALVSFK